MTKTMTTQSDPVASILKDRAKSYDNSVGQAWKLSSELYNWLYEKGLLTRIFSTPYSQPLLMLLNKVVRILQDPHRKDNWLDLSGYAALVFEDLEKES